MLIPQNNIKQEYTEDIRQAPEDEPVCYCSNVSKAEILAARNRGARSLEDIKTMTGACKEGRCQETNPRRR